MRTRFSRPSIRDKRILSPPPGDRPHQVEGQGRESEGRAYGGDWWEGRGSRREDEIIMSGFILEERGRFWWHDEPVPEGCWAPNSENTQIGTLKIDDEGRSTLELDGFLPGIASNFHLFSHYQDLLSHKRSIQGVLKESNKYILLEDVQGFGGMSRSSGISYPGYSANKSLISDDIFRQEPLLFQKMEIDLKGLEQWLRLGKNIKVKNEYPHRVSFSYRRPKEVHYSLDDGAIVLSYRYINVFQFPDSYRFSFNEIVTFFYCPKENKSLEEMEQQFLLIQDFLIMLIGTSFELEWPYLISENGSRKKFYLSRMKGSSKEVEWFNCWTNFVQLKRNFGKIFSTWRKKRESYGSGFYLYLGNLRRMDLYVENRFMNMIWGLESLHRRKYKKQENLGISIKIQRILECLTSKKDREWLKYRLKNASEPSLADRIFQLFSSLPINIEKDKLQIFSKECADTRNSISHFGGRWDEEDGISYSEFTIKVAKISEAITYLYHALILHEIGVKIDIENMNHNGWRLKQSLVNVGLLEQEPPPRLVDQPPPTVSSS